MIQCLETLCALNGVSGDEGQVRSYIRGWAEEHADSVRTDALGNLIVFKRGRKAAENRLMLCAHMDEVGVIVTRATDEGFLKFDFVGGVDRRVALGKPVELGPGRVPGVIGMKAIHLLSREDMKKVPKTSALYLDIGASSREEALSMVPLGTCGAFVGPPERFGDGLFKAKAIDDRVGCAVMLELLREKLPMDVTFAFTVQEEVGTRGAFGAAFSVTPEVALVLETTTAADLPMVEAHRKVCAPGKGPVISSMTGDCSRTCAVWRRSTGSPGRPRNISPGATTPGPSSAPSPACGWPPCLPPCVISTLRPAWAAFPILKPC